MLNKNSRTPKLKLNSHSVETRELRTSKLNKTQIKLHLLKKQEIKEINTSM